MMFTKYLKYHFILTTGQEVYGRVIAWDDQKIMLSLADSPDLLKRAIIFKRAIAMAEPVFTETSEVR